MFASKNSCSVVKKDENYYLKDFLKYFKYIEKEKKMITHIIHELKFSFDDGDESDEEKIKHNHGVIFKKGKFICENGFLKQKM